MAIDVTYWQTGLCVRHTGSVQYYLTRGDLIDLTRALLRIFVVSGTRLLWPSASIKTSIKTAIIGAISTTSIAGTIAGTIVSIVAT